MPTTSATKENSFNVTKDRVQRTLTKTMVNSKVMADKTSHLLVSFLSTILTGVLVLAVSVFLYGTFYYAYMPVEMHHLPVHLQFQPCPDSTMRCSYPSAQLNLKRNQKLLQGQTYSISLKLDIPDSPVNEDHGMFMSCLKISSTSGDQIGEACKSSISEYRSSLLRTMETISYSPALLTGFSAQKQELHINYFSNFQTDPHTPAEVINVEIHSKSLQVTEASLEIHAELKGLRHLMYRHPWVSSFLGVSTNILILTTIILMSWARFLQPEDNLSSSDDATATFHSKPTDAAEKLDSQTQATSKENLASVSKPSESAVERVNEVSPSPPKESLEKRSSLTKRFSWFLVKLVFKLLWTSFKLFLVVALAIVSYEAVMLGVDTDNPDVIMEATKQDIVYLAKFLTEKSFVIVEILRNKINGE